MTDTQRDLHLESILRLAFLAEFRDPDMSHHLRRVSLVARKLAEALGLDATTCEAYELAAPMHDVGKVAVPDDILLKPGRLTEDERLVMQSHTVLGARLLAGSDSELLQLAEAIAHSHHERWDGGGYPQGLIGDEIPLCSRIVALADVYDALVTPRVYKQAVSSDDAQEVLRAESGKHFDPEVVNAFFAIREQVDEVYAEYGEDVAGWII